MTPEKIGRYQIDGEIGRGGMATVFKAYDPRFERHVAVKVLPREFMHDPEFRARFNREAKTIAALEHPAIVPVYDYGDEEGLLYLVMRYMPGGSLSDRLDQGPLSIEESAEILQRLGSALDRAHSQGIIHRDLKPSNVLFDQYGDAFLADFGIVRVAGSDSNLTASGSLVGTPMYMSPEQVYGDKELDGRSDIYALGIILFQMLTGHLPYEADTPAKMMMKHILDPVPDILSARPDLPQGAEAVVSKALAKERDDRFDTAADFTAALSTLTQKSPGSAEIREQLATMQAEIAPAAVALSKAQAAAAKTEAAPIDSEPADLAEEVLAEMARSSSTGALPEKKTPHASGSGSIWAWILVGVLFVSCLGACGVAAFYVSQMEEVAQFALFGGTAVSTETAALPTHTSTPAAFPLLDPAEAAAATEAANLEATRDQLALAATRGGETAVATPIPESDLGNSLAATRESLIATRNAAVQEEAPTVTDGTRASLEATRASAAASTSILSPVFGPVTSELPHELDNIIEMDYAGVNLSNFTARAIVGNPFSRSDGSWDFGLVFRQQEADDELRLVVRSDGLWNLNNRQDNADNFIQEGSVSEYLNLNADGSNEIMLVANDETGLFILNGQLITVLDLSEKDNFGDIALGTGFYSSDEQEGAVTRYTDFTIWPFVPEFGPRSGELEHIDDGFVKMRGADVTLLNFMASATFANPYGEEVGSWDWGFAFRQDDTEYWLMVEADGSWTLLDRRSDGDTYIDEGNGGDNLQTAGGATNDMLLIALNDRGYFFLNGELVAELDLSDRLTSGDVAVVTAFFEGNEVEGYTTEYEGFTVWPLP